MTKQYSKFLSHARRRHPLASMYMNKNRSFARPTPIEERRDDVNSSVTTQVFPNSGYIPEEQVIVDIYEMLKEVNVYSGVEETRLQIVVKGDDGKQNVVRNVKITNMEMK